jgi:DNA-binding FrmR family transcriptional regulator
MKRMLVVALMLTTVGCIDVPAMNGLMDEIIEEHVRAHVAAPDLTAEDRAAGAEELIAVIRRYAK